MWRCTAIICRSRQHSVVTLGWLGRVGRLGRAGAILASRYSRKMLIDLYAELVPHEVQQEIRTSIDTEYAAEQAEKEAARKYTEPPPAVPAVGHTVRR